MTPILRGDYSLIKFKDSMVRGRRNWYDLVGRPNSEEAVLICSVKKVFLKFLQSSQENTLARVSSFLINLLLSSFFTQRLQRLLLLIAITWWKVYSTFKDSAFQKSYAFLQNGYTKDCIWNKTKNSQARTLCSQNKNLL